MVRRDFRRIIQVAVAVLFLTGGSAFGDSFNIHDDWNFGPSNNGVFIYGVADQITPASPYTFTLYTEQVFDGANQLWRLPGQADPNARLHISGEPSHGVPDDTVAFHPAPDNRMSVIRLNTTFETDQVVNISGSFGAGDSGAVDVHIVDVGFGAGNTTLFSVLGTSANTPFILDFILPAGHTIDFLVGSAGNYLFDSTPLIATISTRAVNGSVPEPASGLLVLLSAAGLAALRWRLR